MPIMTKTEVKFFNKLEKAVPEYLIFGQVQLSRLIVPHTDSKADQQYWFNRICRMSVDYVLIDIDCHTVLVAIELDDWSHDSAGRQRQDHKKDKALTSAGIPILRFHCESLPTVRTLRKQILKAINTVA